MGKNLRCDSAISVEEMIEDDTNGPLDGISVAIAQGSDALYVENSDVILLCVSLKRKDLFEGPNQFLVVCLHCSDDEWISTRWNNQKYGV